MTAGLPSTAGGLYLQEGPFGLVAVTSGQNAFFRWNGSGWTPIPAPPTGRATGERHPQRHTPVLDVPLLDLPLDVEGVPTSAATGAADAVLRP